MGKFRVSRAGNPIAGNEEIRVDRDMVQTKRGVWKPCDSITRVRRIETKRGHIEYRGMCGIGYCGAARFGGMR